MIGADNNRNSSSAFASSTPPCESGASLGRLVCAAAAAAIFLLPLSAVGVLNLLAAQAGTSRTSSLTRICASASTSSGFSSCVAWTIA